MTIDPRTGKRPERQKRYNPRWGSKEERARCLKLKPGEQLPQPPSALVYLNEKSQGSRKSTDAERERDARDPSLGKTIGAGARSTHTSNLINGLS